MSARTLFVAAVIHTAKLRKAAYMTAKDQDEEARLVFNATHELEVLVLNDQIPLQVYSELLSDIEDWGLQKTLSLILSEKGGVTA
jgi:hypothetical protein